MIMHMEKCSMRLVMVALLFLLGTQGIAAESTPYTGKVFLGIAGGSVELDEDPRYESTHGVLLTRIAAGSTGEAAGLKKGDTLVSIDDVAWASGEIRLSRSFGKAGDKASPGEKVILSVLRSEKGNDDKQRFERIEAELIRYPRTEPETGGAPTNDMLRPDLKDKYPITHDLCWKFIRAYGFESGCVDLLARLDRSQQFPDPDRLPIVQYACRDPFKLEAIGREVNDGLKPNRSLGVGDCKILLDMAEHVLIKFDRRCLDNNIAMKIPAKTFSGKDLEGHLIYVESVLAAAAETHKKAFAALSESEIQYIRQNRHHLFNSFLTFKMLSYDTDHDRQKAALKVLDLACRVDVGLLIEQGRIISLLVAPEFTSSLKDAAEASGADLDAAVILTRDTAYGAIVVAGRSRQRYGNQDYAVIYELGGDDVYANNQASSVWPDIPSAVIVDYAGDDAYESNDAFQRPWGDSKNVYGNEAANITKGGFSQGCGDLGVGMLVDLAGNDNYVGMCFTQGAAFMGVGLLFDEAGNDVYRGIELHQGIAQQGAGLLIDSAGQDRYEALMTAQGVGLAGGCGMLYDGGKEGDSYYCKGRQPTGYGTAGVFEGWGQGVGIGYRPYASGGVGILFDRAGADRMEAGNFSQGGGYYYGLGMLLCAGDENDHYIGSRYAQGFTAHQAAGIMIEAGGNDRYSTRNAVAQGLAWDESVTLFIEEAGDDIYEGGGFSQGASAMNAWAIFLDLDGMDTYLYCDQAANSGNSYHGGTSLSFFVDAGGDDDSYPSKRNNSIDTGGEHFIFADITGTVAEMLQNNATGNPIHEQEGKGKSP
jgi:hypothetical protein